MAGFRHIIDPMSEDATNAPFELSASDDGPGIRVIDHAFPTPPHDSQWAGSADTEGDPLVQTRYQNREITLAVRIAEPSDTPATAFNLVTNPSFETNLTGWTTAGGGVVTVSRDGTQSIIGNFSQKVVTNGAAGSQGVIQSASITVTASTPHTAATYLQGVAGQSYLLRLEERDAADAVVGSTDQTFTATGGWDRATVTRAFGGTGVKARTRIVINGSRAETFWVDGVQLVAEGTPRAYFDGDTPGCTWAGTAHASNASRPASGGPRFYAIIEDLQQKVGKLLREGGTFQLIYPNATRPLVFDVLDADLNMDLGNSFIHARRSVGELKLIAKPFGRGVEQATTLRSETTLPALIAIESSIPGDVSALGRLEIIEAQAIDQYWGVWGIESKNLDTTDPANKKLFYECEALTLQGGSTTAVGAGASGAGNNVVIAGTVGPSYISMLSTQLTGGGAHLGHIGTYRVFMRAAEFGGTGAQNIQYALQWGEGDFRKNTTNTPVTLPGTNFAILDLGYVKLTKATSGTQRWEGRILVRSTSGTTVTSAPLLDCIWLVPVDEGSGEISAGAPVQNATTYSGLDTFDQTAGNLDTKVANVGGTWATSTPGDFSVVAGTTHNVQRTGVSDATLDAGHIATLGATSYVGIQVQADVGTTSSILVGGDSYRFGVLLRYTDASNYLIAVRTRYSATSSRLSVYKRVAGTTTLLGASAPPAALLTSTQTIIVSADAAGRWSAWIFVAGAAQPATPALSGQDTVLATGGALATGKIGLYDAYTSATGPTRTYDNFAAFAQSTDAAVFASRNAEIRSDRVIRQDSGGTLWQTPSKYKGDYLLIPPAGREARKVRYIVKLSRNDPATSSDSGIDDVQARLNVTPRYLTVPD